jgi:hypothetical protein
MGSWRTRWTTDPAFWGSCLRIPGNQSRWRTFRAFARQAQSSKALLTNFSVEKLSRSAESLREVGAGIADGRIRYREEIVDHLEKAPEAFIGMLDGHNFGKPSYEWQPKADAPDVCTL